jgi:hypothetical protein
MCVATKVMRLYCLAIVAGSLTLSAAIAEDVWYPVAVDVWSPPFNAEHRGDTVNIAARMAGKARCQGASR